MKIYVANNDGDWLDRHDRKRNIRNTDWWHSPTARTFRGAAAGDLFFITRTGTRKIAAWGRLKSDYAEAAPESAWCHTSEAYSTDSTYQRRAATVLRVPVGRVGVDSRIGLIALEDLSWFSSGHQPFVPEDFHENIPAGKIYKPFDRGYEYLKALIAGPTKESVTSSVIRNSYLRVTEAQFAEIFLLHSGLASRFEKWLNKTGYLDCPTGAVVG